MDLLAPILAYVGTVTGIVVAAVLSYNSLFEKSHAPRMPQATTIAAARSSAAKMHKPRARHKAGNDAGTRTAAPQMFDRVKPRSRHLTNERARRRLEHRLPAAKEWASRPLPRAPYAFGSAESPRAAFTRGYE